MPKPRSSCRPVNRPVVGVMGGSFDPPHHGHISIAKSFLQSGRIDRLMVVPVFVPPHKSDDLSRYEIRLNMAKAAFSGIRQIEVSDLESRLPVPSYSWNTLMYLKDEAAGSVIRLCIGGDSLAEFTSWFRYKDILRQFELIVAERPGFSRPELPAEFTGRVTFIEHEPLDISATELRRRASDGLLSGDYIPEAVCKIISDEGLYRK
ncbi:MAG: nicotinate (nicotinamide) nucleotide adenylyltransferase [Balneolaceae bacterium]|nr:MAG: nicotinate (nicotinamide) nucleotide adenylyltransferase [Balneolaceae bacterium]